MKKKLYVSSITAAAIISTVLTLLPYKRFDQIGIFGGVTPNLTDSIIADLHDAFTGDSIYFVFLAVFVPVLILPELSISYRRSSMRFFFPVQGLILLGSAFVMAVGMAFGLFEMNIKLLPAFYAALAWVSASAIFSFLLVFKRIRNLVGTVFNMEARPKQLQLI